MPNIPTDSDAGPQSAIGVGQTDTLFKSFHEAQPNWVLDGYGIRGPQRQRVSAPTERPPSMEFGSDQGRRGGDVSPPGACLPDALPNNTDTFLWGAIAGNCQWIRVCNTSCV